MPISRGAWGRVDSLLDPSGEAYQEAFAAAFDSGVPVYREELPEPLKTEMSEWVERSRKESGTWPNWYGDKE
jgi:hypothetical protein